MINVSLKKLILLSACAISTPLLAAEQNVQADFPNSVVYDTNVSAGLDAAWYDDATTRYAHGVLGDAIEPATLRAKATDGKLYSVKLEEAQVFEDIKPRLADIDGDGQNEIITIRSHNQKGGQIAVYGIKQGQLSIVASTPYIGQSYRWLAPIGIADFNNDGAMDIAYIDRPHLAKILRVWSYQQGGLVQVAQKQGLTNHKIGHDYITGGVRVCSDKATMITVDSDWQQLVETSFADGKLSSENIGPYQGKASAQNALKCS